MAGPAGRLHEHARRAAPVAWRRSAHGNAAARRRRRRRSRRAATPTTGPVGPIVIDLRRPADDPRPARGARRTTSTASAPAGRPAELRRERPAVPARRPSARAAAASHARRRVARRQTPRSARVPRATRCSHTAGAVRAHERRAHDVRLIGDRRGAAARRIDERQPGAAPVVRADEHEAIDRPGRERLRRQVHRPRRAAEHADGQPLPDERARASCTPSSRYHARAAATAAGGPTPDTAVAPTAGPRPPSVGGRATAPVLMSAIAASGTRPRIHRMGSTRETSSGGDRCWREEGEGAMVTTPAHLPLIRRTGSPVAASGTLHRATRGLSAPPDPTRFGREAGVSPAQSRYGDRPLGRKSGRRPAVAARAFERKVRRHVRSTA